MPQHILKNENLISKCLLEYNDIEPILQRGVDANGITDKGMPYLTPLLWNALMYMDDWNQEKKNIEILLHFPIDCNYIGMCGINLYHLYIIQALLEPTSIYKLAWWIRFPMINVNLPLLNIKEKKKSRVHIQHPLEFIMSIAQEHSINPDKVIHLLIAHGLTITPNYTNLFPSVHELDPSSPLFFRVHKQWDDHYFPITDLDALFEKRKTQMSIYHVLPSPQMNESYEIPISHFLSFPSQDKIFLFHASYMDIIIKTQVFPFTHEKIDVKQIDIWLHQMMESWFPREEFLTREIMDQFPLYANYICEDMYPDMAIRLLNDWIASFYPYSRIMILLDLPKKEGIFEYICREMPQGTFLFNAFQNICKKECDRWQDLFFWASYDSLEEGYIFSNRLEELISHLELFAEFQNYIPSSFHTLFTNHVSFQKSSFYDLHRHRFQFVIDQYDYSIFQIYHFMRKISLILCV
jgi:hypothetical protein